MIYVGRAEHDGNMLVCKVVPSKQIGYISLRGEALPKDKFEMLCGENLAWSKCYDHVIPDTAVLCGRTSLDQPVYIGRGHYEGHLIIGKISSVHRALFIAYRGAERRLDSYEILVEGERSVPGWQLPPPPMSMELAEKCPLTPPPPPPPPAIARKPYPYPPDFDAMPFPLNDRPPQYTPMPMPGASPFAAGAPPPPPPEPTILPTYKRPLAVPVGIPPKSHLPPAYTPATMVPAATVGFTPAQVAPPSASFVMPAETYKPPLDPYAPSCSSYTPAECAPSYSGPSTHGASTDYDLWMGASPGYTPPDAVFGGHDSDMAPLLVCRAFYAGSHIPGKAAPSHGCAYIAQAGRELVESRYEVLIGQSKYHWVPGCEGSIAAGAVEAGRASNGEPLFVGRGHYCGSLTPGKIQQSHRCLQIPFGGQEVRISSYEILVRSDLYHRHQAINLSY
ncbi:lipoma-preferred partner [Drosophila grimshawi]|nr:lipoma-preferred partner [Drosophila grimshawi]